MTRKKEAFKDFKVHVEKMGDNPLTNRDRSLERLMEEVQICKTSYSEDHPIQTANYHLLANAYLGLNNYVEAIEWYKKDLDSSLHNFGNSHPIIIDIYEKLAYCHQVIGNYEIALQHQRVKLELQLKLYEEKYSGLEKTYWAMAELHHRLNTFDKVIENCQKVLEIKLRTHHKHHPDLQRIYDLSSEAHYKVKNYKTALQMYRKSFNITLQDLGKNHPKVVTGRIKLCRMFQSFGGYKEGLAEAKEALLILCCKSNSMIHTDILEAIEEFFNCYVNLPFPDQEALDKIQPLVLSLFGEADPIMQKFQNQKSLVKSKSRGC